MTATKRKKAATPPKAPPLDYSLLVKRQVWVEAKGRRLLRVDAVKAGPRMGFVSIRGSSASYEGRGRDGKDRWGWNGPAFTVLAADIIGVYFRRNTIPVAEFLAD